MKTNSDEANISEKRELEPVIREIVRAIHGVNYGSVEVVIHNSRVVQIERKEKIRFDKS
jgi:hypothetical protein